MSATTGQHYRLPSEAEWEYAARAGTVTSRPWGDDIGTDRAACDGCSTVWPQWRVGPVGLHAPNGFGLYDMSGNVWEWCSDWYDRDLYKKRRGLGVDIHTDEALTGDPTMVEFARIVRGIFKSCIFRG